MERDSCVIDFPPDLRERAEAAVREDTPDLGRMSPDQIRELVHELRVGSAERNLQNEVLRKACAEYSRRAEEARSLLENSPDVISLAETREKLRENEYRFRTVSELITDYAYSFCVDPTSRLDVEWVYGAFEQITGYTPEDANVQNDWTRIIHPDDRAIGQHRIDELLSGNTVKTRLRILAKDGTVHWMQDNARPVKDEQGRVVRVIGAAAEISDLKQAEENLRTSKDELEEQVWRRTVELEKSVTNLREEVSERERAEAELVKYREHLEELATKRTAQLEKEIEERKQIEEKLRVSEGRLDAFFRLVPAGLNLLDDQFRYLRVNELAARYMGLPPEEIIGKSIEEIAPKYAPDAEAIFRKVLESGKTVSGVELCGEYPGCPPGTAWWLLSYFPIDMPGGKREIGVVAMDITERKRAEAVLRRYELLSAHSRDSILYLRYDDQRILEANAAAANTYGYSREELLNMTVQDLRAPNKQGLTAQQMAEAYDHGLLFETIHRRKDGSTFPVEVSSAGAIIGGVRTLISIIRDITDRRRIEKEIEWMSRFPGESPYPVLRISAEGKILYANKSSENLLTHWQVQSGDTLPKPWQYVVREVIHKREDQAREIVCCNRIYSVTFTPVPGKEYVNLYASDITDRKRAEEALAESEKRYRIMGESIDYGVWAADAEGKASYISSSFCDMVGKTCEEILEFGWIDKLVPEQRNEVVDLWTHSVSTGEPFEHEHHFIDKDGQIRIVLARGKPVRDEKGQIVSWAGINLDITERKRAEERLAIALEQAEEGRNILDALMEYIPMGITIADAPDVNIRMVSKYGRELLEKPSEEITGIPAPEHPSKWGVYHSDGVTPGTPEELPLTRATVKGEIVRNEEWIVTRKDGMLIPILCNAAPILDKGGNVIGGVIGWQDITSQRLAREALQESERRYRELFETMQEALFVAEVITDKQGHPIDWRYVEGNPAMVRYMEKSREELIGHTYREVVPHPDQGWIDLVGEVALTGKPLTQERFAPTRGRWTYLTAYSPRPGQAAVLFTDITERKLAEDAVRESEALLDAFFSNTPEGMIIYSEDNRYVRINQYAANLYGMSASELAGESIYDVLPPELAHATVERNKAVLEANQPVATGIYRAQLPLHSPDAKITWWQVVRFPVSLPGGKRGVGVVTLDVSEQVRVEKALRENEEDLNRAQAVAQTGSWRLDIRRNVLLWSAESYRIFGIPQGTPMTYELFLDTIHPEDREYVDQKWMAALRGEPYDIEHRIVADDTVKWVREKAEMEFDPEGNLKGGFGTTQDITERKRAEEALRESEGRFRTLINNLSTGIVLIDEQGRFAIVNPEFLRIFGLPENSEIYNVNSADWSQWQVFNEEGALLHVDDHPVRKAALTGQPVNNQVVAVKRPSDQATVWLSISVTTLSAAESDSSQFVVSYSDITERKEAENRIQEYAESLRRQTAQLQAANKELESFSYSISHDLRAPLRSLDGFSLALEEDYGDKLDEQGHDYINRIRAAAQRMARLIEDLLQLSRTSRAELKYTTFNFSDQAKSVLDELHNAEPERKVETVIQEGMIVEGDETLLRQVLQNLLGNAWKFTLHTENARIEFGETRENGKRAFFIRDNGAGFDMRYANKLFIPFQRLHSETEFSGTGIGLSIVKRIIDRHGGTIRAESEPGKGTTFFFTLGE